MTITGFPDKVLPTTIPAFMCCVPRARALRPSEEKMTDAPIGCPLISATDLNTLLQGEDEIALLDAREELSFGQAHILYASCLPLSQIENQ